MRRLCRCGGILGAPLVLVASFSTVATAEPITALYDVQIVFRYNYSSEQYESYPQLFSLRMTFDPATSHRVGDYGAPTFSEVPLPVPDPPFGVPLSTESFTSHSSEPESEEVGSTYTQYAVAASVTSTQGSGDQLFYRPLYLESLFTGLGSRSPISAETFPIHLGMTGGDANNVNGYGNFSFATIRHTSAGLVTSDSYAYWGDARLIRVDSPAPVPEPGTILLVATGGLMGLIGRVHRRRKHCTPDAVLTCPATPVCQSGVHEKAADRC